LKITECQLPVIQLIHIFLENVEAGIGVDGWVEENGVIQACDSTPHLHFQWMEKLLVNGMRIFSSPRAYILLDDISQQAKPSYRETPCCVQDVGVWVTNILKPLAVGYSFLHARRLELLHNSNMVQVNSSLPCCSLTANVMTLQAKPEATACCVPCYWSLEADHLCAGPVGFLHSPLPGPSSGYCFLMVL
jgi:hypothetical protein